MALDAPARPSSLALATERAAPEAAERLRAALRRAAWTLALMHGTWVVLSWGLAVHYPFGGVVPSEAALLQDWAAALPEGVRAPVAAWLAGGAVFGRNDVRLAVAGAALAAPIVLALVVLGRVVRSPAAGDPGVQRLLFRGGVGFTLLNLLAYPTCTQDPWLGIAWGRMLATGANPYHDALGASYLVGLPLEPSALPFTYGPLWLLALGGIAWVGAGQPALELAALKLVLGACWIACLVLARRAASARGPDRRPAVVLALLGWLPLGVHYAVAEAHNDVVLAMGLLAWLAAVERRAAHAPWALVGSVLVKYVTAPLLLVEAWRVLRGGAAMRRTAWALLASLLLGAVLLSLFARDPGFLAGTAKMRFALLSAPKALRLLVAPLPVPGLSARAAELLVGGLLLAAFLPAALRCLRAPTPAAVTGVAFGLLTATALVGLRHTWPWFLIWPLAAGSLAWPARTLRMLSGLLIVAPLFDLFWLQDGTWRVGDAWTLGLFGAAAAFTPLGWWLLRPPPAPG